MQDIIFRTATISDVAGLVELRRQLHVETGEQTGTAPVEITTAQRRWFADRLSAHEFVAWVAEHDGTLVACSGMTFLPTPPCPGNLAGLEAYIMNMYTRPAWRRRGVATGLLGSLFTEARERGAGKVWLRAEPGIGTLYATAGFATADGYMEMMLDDLADPQRQA